MLSHCFLLKSRLSIDQMLYLITLFVRPVEDNKGDKIFSF